MANHSFHPIYFLILVLGSFISAQPLQAQTSLRYGVEYKCGERFTVYYCRSDDQSRDAYPVNPLDDYCKVAYPDRRASTPGYVYEGSELKGEIIKKLQACGALSSPQQKSVQQPNASANNTATAGKSAKDYFLQGQQLYQEKKYGEAIEVLKKAIAVDPSYGYAIFYLAMSYGRQKQYAQTIPLYKQLLTAKWNESEGGLKRIQVMQLLGASYLETTQYADAEAIYRQTVAMEPKDPYCQFGLGRSLALQGKKTEALQTQRVLLTLDKGLADKLSQIIEQGTSGQAQAASVVATAPVPAAQTKVGNADLATGMKYYEAKDYPNAILSYQKALTVAADTKSRAEIHYRIGNAYLAQKQYEKGKSSYQEAIRLDPKLQDAQVGLGACYYYLLKYPEAAAAFERAVQLNPADYISYDWLAATQSARLNRDEAVAAWTKAVALKPRDASFLVGVGNSLSEKRAYDVAITAFRQAIELKPEGETLVSAQYGLGVACKEREQYPEAIAALREAVRLKPNYAGAHFELGQTYYLAERPALAIPAFRNAIRIKPSYGMAYLYLGDAYNRNKQSDLAMAAWKHILAMPTKEKKVLSYLGADFESNKLYDLAIEAYRSALTAQPSYDGDPLDGAFASLTQDSDCYSGLARIYYEQKKYLEIVRLAEAAPENAYIFAHELGNAHLGLDQLAKAAKVFEDAVKLDEEKRAESLYDLGHCYNLMGRKPDARRIYAKLRAIEQEMATKLLAEINGTK